jgi:hypothetical protein
MEKKKEIEEASDVVHIKGGWEHELQQGRDACKFGLDGEV